MRGERSGGGGAWVGCVGLKVGRHLDRGLGVGLQSHPFGRPFFFFLFIWWGEAAGVHNMDCVILIMFGLLLSNTSHIYADTNLIMFFFHSNFLVCCSVVLEPANV